MNKELVGYGSKTESIAMLVVVLYRLYDVKMYDVSVYDVSMYSRTLFDRRMCSPDSRLPGPVGKET